jgi:hypothetical protein
MDRIGVIAAGARIHSGDKHYSRGIGDRGKSTGDGDPAILHRLAQHFEDVFLEFLLGSFNNTPWRLQRSCHEPSTINITAVTD